MIKSVAIAIFVKTPELSPVKTRLAASIGNSAAIEVYENCLKQVEEKISSLKEKLHPEMELTPYWAIAETVSIGSDRWKSFANIDQGPKQQLGDKLDHVFRALKQKHEIIGVMGSDSPFFDPKEIEFGLKWIQSNPNSACIGPTEDGGYYFFASSETIPTSSWTEVNYSRDTTREEFLSALPAEIKVKVLKTHWDIDNESDLKRALEIDPHFTKG